MTLLRTFTLGLAVDLAQISTQAPLATASAAAVAVAESYGFTGAEIEKVFRGEVLTKALKEGSDKELAGVVAIWFPQSVAELASTTLDGTLLNLDPSTRSLQVWKPGEVAGKVFSALQVDAAQQAMLEGRLEAYRKNGLKSAGSPGELLILAINETRSLDRQPGYAKALLSFPADPRTGMEHRFFAYAQDVEGQRTFILSHRSAVLGDHDALITEQRYYVSQAYECRFTVSDCFEARGGTLLFFVTRIFTDRVAGVGSGLKHALGRRKMLADVAEKQKHAREQLARPADQHEKQKQQNGTRHHGRADSRQTESGRGLPIPARR